MYDSVGKFGIDQLNRAIDDGKRCVEQAEQAKAFPGHGVSCQETQRLCLYCAQKLVLHHWLVPLSLCPVVRTKFPNRVIDRVPRVERRGANTLMCPSPLHPWDAINRVPTPLHRFTRPHTDAIKHVIPPLDRVYSQRLCFHGVRLRLQDATMLPEEKVWVDTLMGEILQAGSD